LLKSRAHAKQDKNYGIEENSASNYTAVTGHNTSLTSTTWCRNINSKHTKTLNKLKLILHRP